MKILLLETSSEFALISVIEDKKVLYEEHLLGGPELSKILGSEMEKILQILPPPYERIVVGIGPGSFTGTRVGASMASALSFGWQVPLYIVSSLTGFGPGTVAVDARLGGIYVQDDFEAPKLLSLEEATEFFQKCSCLVSPHPEKILARIPNLKIEKKKPDPLLLIEHAALATQPLKVHYFDGKC